MKTYKWLVQIIVVLLLASFTSGETPTTEDFNIVPRPISIKPLTGSFKLTDQTRILASDSESRRIADFFNDSLLACHGFHLRFAQSKPKTGNYIEFTQADTEGIPAEGYRLVIGTDSVRISGHPAGLFYGMQSLTQMLPMEVKPAIVIPAVEINDHPRFPYRGALLDVGRHFFPASYLKRYIDLLAQYKINYFQLHLTDDQGWRIEIKKYPKLTEIGSHRTETIKAQHFDPYVGDGIPEGGYYTQDQIRDLVAYAQARFITIIPEIEMPGHAQAALAAYPELACTPGPFSVSTTWGVHTDVFCPKEETFKFLEDVLGEVASLFPSPYIHIGGDEVRKDRWKASADAQAVMKREGLKNEEELQSYFIRRIEKFLNSKGKRTIGWDEILQGGLAPNAIVMSWHGETGGIAAAREHHQAIMAPYDYCYLDFGQGDPKREPLNIGGFTPLEKVYGYDPMPKGLAPDEQKYILGAQANLWTEYIGTPKYLEYMTFPRILALSEVMWSSAEGKDYKNFSERLPDQLSRLAKQRVKYRIPEPNGLKDFYTATDDHITVNLNSIEPNSQIYYTLDGSTPTDESARYREPLQIPLEMNQQKVLNLIVATSSRSSVIYGATFLRRSYLDAVNISDAQQGLSFHLYEGKFATTHDMVGASVAQGTTSSFDLQQFGRDKNYGVVFEGYLKVPQDGFFKFETDSDDGAVLRIDGEEVVNNDGIHGGHVADGHIPLRKGFHKFELKYFQAAGDAWLALSWGPSGQEMKPIDETLLFH